MKKLTMLFKGVSLAMLTITHSLAMELPQEQAVVKTTEVPQEATLATAAPLAFPLNNLDDFSNPFSRSVAILQNDLNELSKPLTSDARSSAVALRQAYSELLPEEIKEKVRLYIALKGVDTYPKCATSEDFDALYKAASPVGRSKALINFFDYFIKLNIDEKTAIFTKGGSKFKGVKGMKQAAIEKIRRFFYFVGDLKETVPAQLTEADRTELQECGIKRAHVIEYLMLNAKESDGAYIDSLACSPTFVMMLALERILKDDDMSCTQFFRFQKQLHENAFFGIKSNYNGMPISTRSLIMPERINDQAYYASGYSPLYISPHFTSAMVTGILDRDAAEKQRTSSLHTGLPDEGKVLELHHELISALSPSISVWGKDLHCLKIIENKIIENKAQYYRLAFMPDLAALENLKEIQLSLCGIRQQWIDSFAELSSLDTLRLNNVSFHDVTTFNLQNLKNLSLTNCILSQKTVNLLAQLPKLEVLDIADSDCTQITNWGEGLAKLLPGQGSLKKIIDNDKTQYHPQHSLKNFLETQGLSDPLDLLQVAAAQPPAVAELIPDPQPEETVVYAPDTVTTEELPEEQIDAVPVTEEIESASEAQAEVKPGEEALMGAPALTAATAAPVVPASAVMVSSATTTVLPTAAPVVPASAVMVSSATTTVLPTAVPVVPASAVMVSSAAPTAELVPPIAVTIPHRSPLKMLGLTTVIIGAVYAIYKGVVGKIYAGVGKRLSTAQKQQNPKPSAQRTPQALRQSAV